MNPVPKIRRIVDHALLAEYRLKPCACRSSQCAGDVSPHHIRTRGSGGDDTHQNLLPLCTKHHSEIHQVGTSRFLDKYPALRMSNKNWT